MGSRWNQRMRSFALIACLVATLVLAPAAGAGADAATQRTTSLEAALLQEVNAVRAARGLSALKRSTGLSRAAEVHTVSMLKAGVFAHEIPGAPSLQQRITRFYLAGRPVWSAGENLALFGPTQPSAKSVVAAWLASPPHRANLLARDWRDVGISVRFAPVPGGQLGADPRWLITLDLGRRS